MEVELRWNQDRPLEADCRGKYIAARRDPARRLAFWQEWAGIWGLEVLRRHAEGRRAMFTRWRVR